MWPTEAMSKRLVIDARWLHTGIGRYVMNLLEGLKHRSGFAVHALVRKCDAERVRPLCDKVVIVDLPIYGWREQLSIPWAAQGAELLHVPHYNVPVLFQGEFLATIHDIIHLTDASFRHSIASRVYARPLLRFAARKACRIVTVSNFSRLQLINVLGVPEEQITVIYNGVHPRFRELNHEDAFERVSSELSLTEPYFLYVGNLKPHKNLELLLRAFHHLRTCGMRDHSLVIIGEGKEQMASLRSICDEFKMSSKVRFIPHVGEDMLPYAYAAADLFICPSLMEGFGYPVVEAMACGTPVICSRSSSLPEIAGDAAELFDPTSCQDLATKMQSVLHSQQRREILRQRGLERARIFGWEECGRSHADLYRKLLSV